MKMTSGVPSPPCTVYKPFITPSLEVPGWLGMPCREKAMTDGRGTPSGFFPFALSTAACKHGHNMRMGADQVSPAGSVGRAALPQLCAPTPVTLQPNRVQAEAYRHRHAWSPGHHKVCASISDSSR